VNLTCTGTPKIAVTPTSFNLKARVNSSVTSSFVLQNIGDANLSATVDMGTWTTVSQSFFAIAPHSSELVTITAWCGSRVETRTDNIRITSDDPTTRVLDIPITITCTDIVLSGPKLAKMISSAPSWSGDGLAKVSIPIQNLSTESGTYTASLTGAARVSISGQSGTIDANETVQIGLVGTCLEGFYAGGMNEFTLDIFVEGVLKTSVPVQFFCAPILHAAIVSVEGLDCGARASVSTHKPYPDWFILVGGYGNLITVPGPCLGPSNASAEAKALGKEDADRNLFVPAEPWEFPCRSAIAAGGLPVDCRREQWANAKARFETIVDYVR
jgi:hypothetical protein